MIKITLPGEPIAKMRPKFSKHGTYDPQSAQKHAAKFQVLSQLNRYACLPLTSNVPCELELNFYFAIPSGKESLFDWGLLEHLSKPDYDNCEKFYCDVMNGIVYEDDRQIIQCHSSKQYSHEPRTEILIMPKPHQISSDVEGVLQLISPRELCELAEEMSSLAAICPGNEYERHMDYEEIVMLICKFAEKHADNLKKVAKKYPGLAKVLEENMRNK